MKALFIGCVESSAAFLKTLIEAEADIVGVITKQESEFNSDFVDLSDIAKQNKIPYLYVKNINNNHTYEFIRELHPEVGFCMGWSQLIKKELLDMFPQGIIGFHPTALPQNRGRHPLIWALALGLNETASSFFILDETADTGKVISQERVPILYEDNARTLYDKVMAAAKVQLKELWSDICKNNIQTIVDKEQKGNTWRKRGRDDGRIDWRMSGRNIYNLIRALSEPYAGAHFEYNGYDYKVWEAKELEDALYKNIEPGKIVEVREDRHFVVKTGDGLIELIRFDRQFTPHAGIYL